METVKRVSFTAVTNNLDADGLRYQNVDGTFSFDLQPGLTASAIKI